MFNQFIYGNQSTLCILIASLSLLGVTAKKSSWKNSNLFAKVFLIFIYTSFFGVLLFTKGRAGCLGFIAGFFYFNWQTGAIPKLSKRYSTVLLVLTFLIIASLFWLKRDSSLGRLLVYKVSINIFKDNWLCGAGLSNFPVKYNLYQAKYFSQNNINSKEALLADNTFYAFNDVWQLVIEIGIIRFLLLLILLLFIVKAIKLCTIKVSKTHLFYGASSALLCVVVASLFSYPFHIFSIRLLSLIYLTIILFSLKAPNNAFGVNKWALTILRALSLAGIFFLFVYAGIRLSLLTRAKAAFNLSQAGYKTKALRVYSSLDNCFMKDGAIMFTYAKQLYNINKLQQAKQVITKAKKYYTDNEVYKLSASIESELGNLKEAERDFKTAVYMVPNRMRSRYELLQFYLAKKDTSNAVFWAKSILDMPVKIPSDITSNIKLQTRNMLKNLQ